MVKIRGVVINTTDLGSGFVSTVDDEIAFVPIRVMNTSSAEIGDVVAGLAVENFEEQKGKARYRVIRLDIQKKAFSNDTYLEIAATDPDASIIAAHVGISSIGTDPNSITTQALNEAILKYVTNNESPFIAREAYEWFMEDFGINESDVKTSTRVNSSLQQMHDRGQLPCAKIYKGGSNSVASSVFFCKDIATLKDYLSTKMD